MTVSNCCGKLAVVQSLQRKAVEIITQDKEGDMEKLSDLILRGAKLRPQAIGSFFDELDTHGTDNPTYGSCALGAAIEAGIPQIVDEMFRIVDAREMEKFFEEVGVDDLLPHPCKTGEFDCPCPGRIHASANDNGDYLIQDIVVHLNDMHEMSREDIAEWLKGMGK